MHTQILPRVLTLVLLVLLALTPTGAASAAAPVVVTDSVDVDEPTAFQPCPGIEVRDHEVFTVRVTYYFDNDGNMLRFKYHAIGTDNFYNQQNPGVVLSGSFTHNGEIDLRTGESKSTGIPIHITVPGYGTVLVLAGHWSVFPDDHLAGKDSFEDPEDIAVFCSLLAGN